MGETPPSGSYRCWFCCQYLELHQNNSTMLGCTHDDQCLCLSSKGKFLFGNFELKIKSAIQTLCLISHCALPSEKPNYPCGLGLCGKHCVDVNVSL